MPLPVSLKAVADELSILGDLSSAYVNRRTGEVVTLSEDDQALAEEEDVAEDDLPDWQAEMLPKIREILESDDWVALPGKFDIHEWEIMRRFGASLSDSHGASEIDRAIHGSGAFRMFRATVERLGLRGQWFEFRDRALMDIAREALEEVGIPYE